MDNYDAFKSSITIIYKYTNPLSDVLLLLNKETRKILITRNINIWKKKCGELMKNLNELFNYRENFKLPTYLWNWRSAHAILTTKIKNIDFNVYGKDTFLNHFVSYSHLRFSNELTSFPFHLSLLKKLEHINIYSSNISKTHALKNLSTYNNLKTIELYIADSVVLSPIFSVVNITNVSLKYLNYNSQMHEANFDGIGNSVNLKKLELRSYGKSNLKVINLSTITKLKKLKILYFHKVDCDFNEIFGTQSLNRITISHCNLTEIPKNIALLKKLSYLDISYNHVKNLLDEMAFMENLKDIRYKENHIVKLPKTFNFEMSDDHNIIKKESNLPKNIKYIDCRRNFTGE